MSILKKYSLLDLGFVKTGVNKFHDIKEYYSTGSIKENTVTPEGKYDFDTRPSRANRIAKEDDILQARMMDTNKVILIDKKLDGKLFSTGFFQLRPPRNLVFPKFLYYFLSSKFFLDLKDSLCEGSTQKAINDKNLQKIKIFLPSISVQRSIAAKIDEVFVEIDNAINLIEKKTILSEQLVARTLSSIYFDKKNEGVKQLKQIASIKGGKRLPKGKKLTTKDTGFPYIRVTDFNDHGTIDVKSVKFVDANIQKQIERYTISSKDVYVSIAGTIGKTGIIPESLENANLTENAAKLVLHECVDKDYVYFFTKTSSFEKQAIAQTRTAAQPKLALERLGAVEIPLFNKKKQSEIVSEAKNITSWMNLTRENCYKKLEHFAKLKSAIIMQKLQINKAE